MDLANLQPIHVGFTNCYPIDTGDGLALVDTGTNTEEFWRLLTGGLEDRGYEIGQVRWLVLTHSHLDHSGLAARVKRASGAGVLVHREEAFFLEEGGAQWHNNEANFDRLYLEHGVPREVLEWYHREGRRSRWGRNWKSQPALFERTPERGLRWDLFRAGPRELDREAGAVEEGHHHAPLHRRGDEDDQAWRPSPLQPDRVFEHGEVLELGNLRLRAIHTPGHTPGHACFYSEEEQVLFTGDHILKRITPNPGIYFLNNRYEERTRSLPSYIRSLLGVRDLPCRRVLPAHEAEMNNLEYAVDRIMLHHERRARSGLRAIRLGRSTAFDILPVLFPNLRAFALGPALSETIGHLDLLEEQEQVVVEREAGLVRYHPAPGAGATAD